MFTPNKPVVFFAIIVILFTSVPTHCAAPALQEVTTHNENDEKESEMALLIQSGLWFLVGTISTYRMVFCIKDIIVCEKRNIHHFLDFYEFGTLCIITLGTSYITFGKTKIYKNLLKRWSKNYEH